MNYYNEFDPRAAAWLCELITEGHIPAGDVDTRSIMEVSPNDLRGYTQCHFFAGIGGWSLALRLAGWPDDRPVWTGSCPCQPFSGAGKGGGFADERHLWPAFHHLIRVGKPGVVFGEQVASKDGLAWLDLVHADLEAESYACGALDLCSAGVGAPHIRQRLHWVANATGGGRTQGGEPCGDYGAGGRPSFGGEPSGLGDAAGARLEGYGGPIEVDGSQRWEESPRRSPETGDFGRLADADGERLGAARASGSEYEDAEQRGGLDGAGPTNGFWRAADWLFGRDGKWRPVEPGTFPLAHGVSGRVGLLRGYGNAINPVLTAEFVKAYMEK